MSKETNELSNNTLLDISEFAAKLNDEQEVKPNCKLCNSPHRKEAESMAERNASTSAIHRMLESHGEEISYNAVSNHINYHFKTKQSETDLKEYANQLQRWRQMSHTDEVLLNRYISALDMEAMYLASKNANVDISERRKNTEVIIKITQQISNLKEMLRKLDAERTPVEILFTSLNRIIEVKLTSPTITPEGRKVLQDVIDQLKKEVGEVDIEGVINK